MRLIPITLVLTLALTACSSNKWKAPVESRSGGPNASKPAVVSRSSAKPAASAPVDTPEVDSRPIEKPRPETAAEEASEYRVKPGDTLYGISQSKGVAVDELIAWNQLTEPYTISPGQVLRLNSGVEKVKNVTTASTQSRYSGEQKQEKPVASVPDKSRSNDAPKPAAQKKKTRSVDGLNWQWPVDGRVSQKFSPSDPSRRGIKIAGESGTAITAAEAGEVVYSGDGLVGYGELIIIKHNRQYLSAYGHNRKRLVKEGDKVKRGAVIATMGQLKGKNLLHFEIRRNGKPADPLNYLP